MVDKLIKRWKSEYYKHISKFLKIWTGIKYLFRDDDELWEFWLKTYKEYEEKLK